jgi:carnitine-CoA ligase
VSVPVNTAAKGYFLERYVGHSDCRAILIEPEFLPTLAAVVDALPQLDTLIVLDQWQEQGPPAIPVRLQRLRVLRYADVAAGSDTPVDVAPPAGLVQILYTSGTTGPSKGNMYCQTALLNWGRSVSCGEEVGADDVYYVPFPLHHGTAWFLSLAMLWVGGSIALARRFSASRFMDHARASRATAAVGMGVADFLTVASPSPADRDHRVRQMVCAPLPNNPLAFEERFGLKLISAMGISDYIISLYLGPSAPREKLGSCGRMLPEREIRLVDDEERDVPVGAPGEVLLRCTVPNGAASGYYKMPEETLESRRNLWFHTGDLARRDADGYYYFVDRKKDSIRRRGENISSVELEMVLGRHPGVLASAFFGVRTSTGEDEVAVAVIQREDSALAESSIVEHCRAHMPKFAVPRYVRIMNEFPLTASGKVQKAVLRADTESALDSTWDREKVLEARPHPARGQA